MTSWPISIRPWTALELKPRYSGNYPLQTVLVQIYRRPANGLKPPLLRERHARLYIGASASNLEPDLAESHKQAPDPLRVDGPSSTQRVRGVVSARRAAVSAWRARCFARLENLVVNLIEVNRENCSFGRGKANSSDANTRRLPSFNGGT